jgi:hypothetical protein
MPVLQADLSEKIHRAWIRVVRQNHRIIESDRSCAKHDRQGPIRRRQIRKRAADDLWADPSWGAHRNADV